MDVDQIRNDFPALDQNIDGKPIIYFDNACMTHKPLTVINAMNEYYFKFPACHGRSVHKFATQVSLNYVEARKKIHRFINSREKEEIVFTRNATEAINLVAHSMGWKKGDIVLTTDREHNSNLVPWHMMVRRCGGVHKVLPSNPDYTFNLETFEEMLNRLAPKVKLVSMVHTSNLDGYTIPTEDVIKIAHEHDILVMLDSAQSTPHRPIDVQKMDVDLLAFSLHKMCGPTGIGALYGKFELLQEFEPFMTGGDTVEDTTYNDSNLLDAPERFEAGLQNYAGIIGAGAAVDYLTKIGMENIQNNDLKLNKYIDERFREIPRVTIIGVDDVTQRGGITSFAIEGIDTHSVAMVLDERSNIMVRSGWHCVHSWFNANKINGSVRSSVYFYNTLEEAKNFVDAVELLAEQVGRRK